MKLKVKTITQSPFSHTETIRLKSENELLRNLLHNLPGNIYWKDTSGRYLGMNKSNTQMLGFESPAEIVGKSNSDLFDQKLAAIVDQMDQSIQYSGYEHYFEEQGIDKNNQPAVYLSKKVPLFDRRGNHLGILGISFDITDRKRMEEDLRIAKEKAETANHSKSQFLTVMNHELRTPLACMTSLIELLKQNSLSADEENNILDAMENCTQHLLNLVSEILGFSKLENKNYQVSLSPTNLTGILHKVFGLLNIVAQKKGLALHIDANPEDLSLYILTDEQILHQILVNLVGNALKFTEKGSITIKVRRNNKSTQNQTIAQFEMSVIDTGYGIPEDKINVIFEPFKQLENAYTRASSRNGTGLGLAIVKKLVSLLNATIDVRSELGKGSTFTVNASFNTVDQPATHTSPPKTGNTKKKKKSYTSLPVYPSPLDSQPRVLLIEDDSIMQFIQKRIFSDLGCIVTVLGHGRDATHYHNHHDIIFVDITLPDISGFEVIQAIRQHETNSLVPIIALTVYTGEEEKRACIKAGANEFVSKPASSHQLRKLLIRFLKKAN